MAESFKQVDKHYVLDTGPEAQDWGMVSVEYRGHTIYVNIGGQIDITAYITEDGYLKAEIIQTKVDHLEIDQCRTIK